MKFRLTKLYSRKRQSFQFMDASPVSKSIRGQYEAWKPVDHARVVRTHHKHSNSSTLQIRTVPVYRKNRLSREAQGNNVTHKDESKLLVKPPLASTLCRYSMVLHSTNHSIKRGSSPFLVSVATLTRSPTRFSTHMKSRSGLGVLVHGSSENTKAGVPRRVGARGCDLRHIGYRTHSPPTKR